MSPITRCQEVARMAGELGGHHNAINFGLLHRLQPRESSYLTALPGAQHANNCVAALVDDGSRGP